VRSRALFIGVAASLAGALVASGCGSSSKGASSGTTAPAASSGGTTGATTGGSAGSAATGGTGADGVTASTVTFGFISPQTGAQAAVFPGAVAGCKAAVGLQNAQGGVNGRKVVVQYGDDQSSYTGLNTTIAQHMVQSQHAFMVVNDSGAALQTYRALEALGVPMIDYGGNTYEGDPANQNWVIPTSGNINTNPTTTYDLGVKIMKAMGATKIAAVGFATAFSPGSHAIAINTEKDATAEGLKAVYLNDTLGTSTASLGPVILGIKNSGADGLIVPMQVSTTLSLVSGLRQAGVKMKSVVGLQGYGQDLLKPSVAATLGPEDVFQTGFAPVELNTPATKQFQSALQQYGGLKGIPDFGAYTGYQTCELAMLGIQHAGNPPTRAAFVPGLRALKTVNPGNLSCAPADVSTENYGKTPSQTCAWFVYVKDGHWVINPQSGQPWLSTVIPSSTPAGSTFTGPPPSMATVK
jgi:ABC-type branched-subunit amino acid transport system substrate-binding protein